MCQRLLYISTSNFLEGVGEKNNYRREEIRFEEREEPNLFLERSLASLPFTPP
jgi:hypothetical protein